MAKFVSVMPGTTRLALGLSLLAALIPVTPVAGVVPVPCTQAGGLSDRCEIWAARASRGEAEDVLADPSAGRVYVAATAVGPQGGSGDAFVYAYKSSTGAELWRLSRDGGANDYDAANDLTLSGDGSRLCLSAGITPGAGPVQGVPSGADILVLCVHPDSGELLWERTYDMPTGRDDTADGGMIEASVPVAGQRRDTLFVGGFSGPAPLMDDGTSKDLLTLAIDPETGNVLWKATYDGPGNAWEVPRGFAVSPDGRRVFITGESAGVGTWHDYATVAYDAATGEQLWASRYEGLGGNLADEPNALTLSPAGDMVVVTGGSEESPGDFRWATVAYDSATGEELWAARYAGTPPPSPVPGDIRPTGGSPNFHLTGRDDEATALVFSPGGTAVYVTGFARAFPNGTDYITIAYSTSDGEAQWTGRYDGPAHRLDQAADIAVNASGSRIYVTGNSSGVGLWIQGDQDTRGYALDDVATVAYDAAGTQQWAARYDGDQYTDVGSALELGGDILYVAGRAGWKDPQELFSLNHADPLTLAYAA
ncbi:MAG: PQQ-binding-like beta-propeller repeat protein [Actinomycetota bacterium]